MSARSDTRQTLLDEGRRLASEKGLRALTVRELAARTGINLGSFVYHFGTRERFISELVEGWYAPMLQHLQLTAAPARGQRALDRLRATLLQLIAYMDANATFITHLVADAMAGEKAVWPFLRAIPGRHPKLLFELTAEAQAEGDLIAGDPRRLMIFVLMSVGLPLLLAEGPLKSLESLPQELGQLRAWMRSPDAACERLHWALNGISTSRGLP